MGVTHTESYQDHEMSKGQDIVDSTLDKVRALIVKKTIESDKLIDQLGLQLNENRKKLKMFKSQLHSLDVDDISLASEKQSSSQTKVEASIDAQAEESDRSLEQAISDVYSEIQSINGRTIKFFNQMKQLATDHYDWLKHQKFQQT